MLRINLGVFSIALPLLLSRLAVNSSSPLLYAVFLLSHFLLLAVVPLFKKRENLWMFILTALSFIPINVMVLEFLKEADFVSLRVTVLGYMELAMYYMALFGVEQAVMGVITRLLWRSQYKIKLDTEG